MHGTSREPNLSSRATQFLIVAFLLTIGFGVIGLRLFVIQGFQYDKWHQLAKRQHEHTIAVHSERGTIYDRHGKILAINVDVPSLYAIPEKIEKPQETARRLTPYVKIAPEKLVRQFQRRRGFFWIKRKMDPTQWETLRAFQLPGIDVLMESKRFYPKQTLFSHIIGFTGIDNQGMEGIEYRYEKKLRGKDGEVIVVRDAYGQSIYPKGFKDVPPARGQDLSLTLDETIQHITARELHQALVRAGAKRGTAIVMNPHDGAILAMVMDPPFDPNAISRYQPADWRNRAITDMYEPGSTFKIVAASGALEEGIVRPEEMINCENGAYAIAQTVIHDHHPIGTVSFADVISKSSNIGMVKVASRLGPSRLFTYAQAFGFGSLRGIDLSGESPGLLRDIGQWSERSLASIAIGQEVAVTPLQMTVAMSVIANGGWRVTPHVAHLDHEEQGNVPRPVAAAFDPSLSKSEDPTLRRQQAPRILSEKTVTTMTALLKRVAQKGGTGTRAAISGFDVAGKTGTAQKVDPVTGRYAENSYMSSFIGFVPADAPVVTIFVMLDEPVNATYGGEVAAPAFSIIGREILHYLKISPTRPTPEKKVFETT